MRSIQKSHPSRVRGLKRILDSGVLGEYGVAPLAGAWIETLNGVRSLRPSTVAPLAGAWIETIETRSSCLRHRRSHPSRVRGLKHGRACRCRGRMLSHPSRVRGLKHRMRGLLPRCSRVAPLAGAWIETSPEPVNSRNLACRTPRGCVD